jgi:hypothetical protein
MTQLVHDADFGVTTGYWRSPEFNRDEEAGAVLVRLLRAVSGR